MCGRTDTLTDRHSGHTYVSLVKHSKQSVTSRKRLRNQEMKTARRNFDASGLLKPSWDVENPAGNTPRPDTDVQQPSSIHGGYTLCNQMAFGDKTRRCAVGRQE